MRTGTARTGAVNRVGDVFSQDLSRNPEKVSKSEQESVPQGLKHRSFLGFLRHG